MTSAERLARYPVEMRRVLAARSSTVNRAKAETAMVEAIVRALRGGRPILFTSDNDGVMSPFVADARRSRVHPGVRLAYCAYEPIADLWVVTGGDADRTQVVQEASGLRINALCGYDTERLEWQGSNAVITRHPRTPEIEPFLEDIAQRLEAHLAHRLGLPPGDAALRSSGTEADTLDRVHCERKGTVIAFQPKGRVRINELAALLGELVPLAVAETKTAFQRELATEGLTESRRALLDEAVEKIVIKGNNGNLEVKWDLGRTKYSALDRLITRYQPAVVLFNGDDNGDLPAVQRLQEARRAGLTTFIGCVANAPEPETARVGTPSALIEASDVTFLSCADMADFYAQVIRRAVRENPDLSPLRDAVALLSMSMDGPRLGA